MNTERTINLQSRPGTVNWCIEILESHGDPITLAEIRERLTEGARKITADGFNVEDIKISVGAAEYEYSTPPLEMIARRNCSSEEDVAARGEQEQMERRRLEQQIEIAKANLARLEQRL